jgi:chemotaxis protein methyltransferase CheR
MTMTSSTVAAEHDGPLTERNFKQLAAFVHSYCGITITAKKRTMVEGRLRRRMRALNITDLNDYCEFLFKDKRGEEEIVNFIDAITTNKTDFFRENGHFDFIRSRILPRLADAGQRKLKVWSAASSTGAEAYTIAMVLDDFGRNAWEFDYTILATDICTDVLNKGLAGRYPITMIDPIPEEMRRRYVMLSRSPGCQEFRIVPALRQKVAFTQLNLMDTDYRLRTEFDMIFCRNILIYFDRPTQGAVLSRLCGHLREGGHMFLGHSETIAGIDLPLTPVATTVFERRAHGGRESQNKGTGRR